MGTAIGEIVRLVTVCTMVLLDVFPIPNAPLGNLWREIKVEACPAWNGTEVRVSGRVYQEAEAKDGPERFYLQDGAWKVMASTIRRCEGSTDSPTGY